ncbi:hypothetical protein DEJ70_00860 [Wolbachia pipientis wAlbB]|nr:hypothetical protein DEJ70_00860 [Wolbachia pipientis wAlbB]
MSATRMTNMDYFNYTIVKETRKAVIKAEALLEIPQLLGR